MLAFISVIAVALMGTGAIAGTYPPCDCYVELYGKYRCVLNPCSLVAFRKAPVCPSFSER
jgi:hypothetical protein